MKSLLLFLLFFLQLFQFSFCQIDTSQLIGNWIFYPQKKNPDTLNFEKMDKSFPNTFINCTLWDIQSSANFLINERIASEVKPDTINKPVKNDKEMNSTNIENEDVN